MPIKPVQYPKGHLPEIASRTAYRNSSNSNRGNYLPIDLAQIVQKVLDKGWTVHLVEDRSPIFIDSYGREADSPFAVIRGTEGPTYCYNDYQIFSSPSSADYPHECKLYVRDKDNDTTQIKFQRWTESITKHLTGVLYQG